VKKDFWQQRWQESRIGFHEGKVNRHLEAHWTHLQPGDQETVFVPLCGKAIDLTWLRRRGHRVIGVELSELACQAFFAEQGIEPRISSTGSFVRYDHDGIDILCGDFFDLTPEHLDGATLFYDRAALIAMPPDMRPGYCSHLAHVLSPECRGLLITLDYPHQAFTGPPFAVPEAEVREHLGQRFKVDRLHFATLGPSDPLADRGLQGGSESVFGLFPNR
jgi:thiopurine S-methyltransferase